MWAARYALAAPGPDHPWARNCSENKGEREFKVGSVLCTVRRVMVARLLDAFIISLCVATQPRGMMSRRGQPWIWKRVSVAAKDLWGRDKFNWQQSLDAESKQAGDHVSHTHAYAPGVKSGAVCFRPISWVKRSWGHRCTTACFCLSPPSLRLCLLCLSHTPSGRGWNEQSILGRTKTVTRSAVWQCTVKLLEMSNIAEIRVQRWERV